MKKIKVLPAMLIFCCLAFFCQTNVYAQKKYVINSSNLKTNDTVLVFTPSGWNIESGKGTPALFLLHGWSGCWSDWSKKTDIQELSNKWGFIIITPDGFYNSWYLNNIDKNKMQWKTFFHNELYPMMVKEYGLVPEKTFISGLSMGGHGALSTFLDDVSKFRAGGSMSGVLYLPDSKRKDYQLSQVIGPYSEGCTSFETNSVTTRLDSTMLNPAFKAGDKLLLATCGSQDYYANSTLNFAKRCEELKIPHVLIMSPGAHTWKYWKFAVEQHLFIYSRMAENKGLGY